MKKYIFAILILFVSCSYNVTVDDLIVTNDMCDDMIEQFVVEDDPNYTPKDYGCTGYNTDENDICLTECIQQDDCDSEHYCDYQSATCILKGVGRCEGDDYCRKGVCLCDMCLDLTSIVFGD